MGYIRVRNKLTGKVGLLPEESFNEGKYEMMGPKQSQSAPTPQATVATDDSAQQSNPGFLGSIVKGMTQPFVNTGKRLGGAAEVLTKEWLLGQSEKARQSGDLERAQRLSEIASRDTDLTQRTAEQGNWKTTETNPLQMGKDLAATASWAVPVGKTARVLGKTVKTSVGGGGALAGTLGGFGYSNKEDLGGIATDTAIGAGTGFATAKILNRLLKGKDPMKEEGQNYISKKASENVLKMSPSDFVNAKEMGIDPRNLIPKHSIVGNNYGELIEDTALKLSRHEQRIQSVVLNNVDEVVSIEPSIGALKGIRDTLSKSPTNATKVAQLDSLINEMGKSPNMKAPDAMTVLRSANEKFGQAIFQEERGAINTQVNKIVANNLRKTLRARFPEIATNLDSQHELLILKPILQRAEGKVSVGGTGGMTGFEVQKPLKVFAPITENPAVASRVAQTEMPDVGAKLSGFLGQKAPDKAPALASFLVGPKGQTTGEATGEESYDSANITIGGQTYDIDDSTGIPIPVTPGTAAKPAQKADMKKQFDKAMLTDLVTNDGKNQTKIKAVYDFLYSSDAVEAVKPTAKDISAAKSGTRSASEVRKMLKADPSLLAKQLIPGKFASRSFDAAVYNMADSVLRIKTGAQANADEIRGYMHRLAVSFGDNPKDIEFKMTQLEGVFSDTLNWSE